MPIPFVEAAHSIIQSPAFDDAFFVYGLWGRILFKIHPQRPHHQASGRRKWENGDGYGDPTGGTGLYGGTLCSPYESGEGDGAAV
jgi:hypothetical protein